MIYCECGVLSHKKRKLLLHKMFRALKPHGVFAFDVLTTKKDEGKAESRVWNYFDSGFYKPTPYISLDSFYIYDHDNTYLNQVLILSDNIECYNIWEHTFTMAELESELRNTGFSSIHFFGDIAGAPYNSKNETICVLASKNNSFKPI